MATDKNDLEQCQQLVSVKAGETGQQWHDRYDKMRADEAAKQDALLKAWEANRSLSPHMPPTDEELTRWLTNAEERLEKSLLPDAADIMRLIKEVQRLKVSDQYLQNFVDLIGEDITAKEFAWVQLAHYVQLGKTEAARRRAEKATQ